MAADASPGTTQQRRTPGTAVSKASISVGHGEVLRAIEKHLRDNSVSVHLAPLGTVRLPALDSLAWMAGLAALAAFDILEWPVAAAIGAGHLLAHQQHLRLLKDFGEALEGA